jgi:uncharacterized protein YfdQ (DUF2303 family)
MYENADMKAVIDTAQRAVEPQIIDPGSLVFSMPPGAEQAQILDTEKFLPAPNRKRGAVELFTAQSFLDYVIDHRTAGSRIFADADWRQPSITAVMNGHEADGGVAGWHDHKAKLVFRPTPEWQNWTRLNNQQMTQIAFAEFIEDNLKDIHAPAGADMLEIAQTLNAKRDVTFRSGTKIANGETLIEYNEVINGTAGRGGNFKIPDHMVLGIQPFEGTDAYRVIARFRYRIDSETKSLKVWFTLERLPDIIAAVIKDALDLIIKTAGVPVLYGKPPVLPS